MLSSGELIDAAATATDDAADAADADADADDAAVELSVTPAIRVWRPSER